MSNWKSIKEAPKIYGHEILATNYQTIEIVRCIDPLGIANPSYVKRNGDAYSPALWQPLPRIPTKSPH